MSNLKGIIKDFSKALNENNAAIFAGAGLSSGAEFVNWTELLRSVAEELHLEIEREHDLVSLAQYYCNEHKGRGRLNQIITDEFQRRASITENHRILARLPIQTYWTTNYDTLIETSLRDNGKNPDVKINPENLAITLSDRDAIVYKMHGDVSQVHKAIITRDDYEKYELTHSLFTTALQGDLVSKTFLFIGFSFNDPNLNYILSRIRIRLEGNQRPHYCFLKRIVESDFSSKEDYEYAKIKQELQINDLKRFSINTILVDEYQEITRILAMIENSFKKNSVFISGSAEDYGAMPENAAIELLHALSYELVKRDYRVISGFGLGVGSYVINGALDCLQSERKNRKENNLVLRPFPQKPSGGKSLPELWDFYRHNMISEAGIAIFLFGNKKVDGNVVDAGGVRSEFEIACSMGVNVIPVGITGYQSKILWEEIMSYLPKYYPETQVFRPLFEILGSNSKPSEIINTIMKIIDEIRRRM
ncbi:MAG: SIR2 family protein [Desulfitobacterium hafniense]|nr:SIR2 family protein [Desulfitobacterium hafniense]